MQSENNKKIALIHHNLDIAGGAEKCVFTAIDALNEINIIPDVFAINDATPEKFINNFGKPIRYNFKRIINLNMKGFDIYKNPLINLLTGKLSQYDHIFNFTGSCLFVPDRINYILYVHFPDRGLIEYSERYKRGFWKLYGLPVNILSRISKLGEKITIVCNSQFTKSVLLKFYKVDESRIQIIHPPVVIGSKVNDDIEKKEEIATLGRFTSVKRQMEQIEIASLFPDLKFNIIGSVTFSHTSDAYFRQCQDYIEKNNIKNVNLFANISRSELISILRTSKYFLQNMHHEHFGISTVEAIAQGCIPIVHNSGGQKEIVPFRELRFDDKDEAVEIIRALRKKDNTEILSKLKENIKNFSEENYKQNILGLLKF
jgi:glycosyltransferase involved in cell wall biosynthesis